MINSVVFDETAGLTRGSRKPLHSYLHVKIGPFILLHQAYDNGLAYSRTTSYVGSWGNAIFSPHNASSQLLYHAPQPIISTAPCREITRNQTYASVVIHLRDRRLKTLSITYIKAMYSSYHLEIDICLLTIFTCPQHNVLVLSRRQHIFQHVRPVLRFSNWRRDR
jgi:hypothetical protein